MDAEILNTGSGFVTASNRLAAAIHWVKS